MIYTFSCPLCHKCFRSEEPGEPCCTGPSETRDDHEMVVMRLQAIDKSEIDPLQAEARVAGPLIIGDWPHAQR